MLHFVLGVQSLQVSLTVAAGALPGVLHFPEATAGVLHPSTPVPVCTLARARAHTHTHTQAPAQLHGVLGGRSDSVQSGAVSTPKAPSVPV